MDNEIIIAIIAAVATVTTVIGSIIATALTNNSQQEQQRIEAVRDMKRTYYNSFIEAYTRKLQFVAKPDSPEKIEAEMQFMLEVNRLPLYASQEMVEFISAMHDETTAKNTSTSDFFVIMRRDLCSNNFQPFDNLKETPISLSNKVVIVDPKGKKTIQ